MLEQRRLDYLQAMGVVQWLPRQPLPHGPAPRWLPETTAAAAQAKPSFTHPGGHIAHPAANQLLHHSASGARPNLTAMLEPDAEPATAAAAVAAPVVTAAVENTTAAAPDPTVVPQFRLYFFRTSLPFIWVCDQAEAAEQLPPLLFRIQQALTGQAQFVPSPQEFRWPFIASAHDDQTTPVALRALQAQWQHLCGADTLAAVTVGEDSRYWLQQIGTEPRSHIASLPELQRSAAAKRQLWLDLLALCGA
ncbi:hypothetical protein GJQ54_11735 [Oceanospirillaceae bacterium ASx5O]|nr:hypothetical protein GJQ54_11735 [Oceanospirillaceae bacterium ASx5O]